MPKVSIDKSYLTGVDYITNWEGWQKAYAEKTARFERLGGKGRKTKETKQLEEPLEMV